MELKENRNTEEMSKFKCYEYHRPNIPSNGCETQCKECEHTDYIVDKRISEYKEKLVTELEKGNPYRINSHEFKGYYRAISRLKAMK